MRDQATIASSVDIFEGFDVQDLAAAPGLSRLELALIQPCYGLDFNMTVTQSAGMTESIRGSVNDYFCGVKCTLFDFGEGDLEQSQVVLGPIPSKYRTPAHSPVCM